MTDTLTDDTIGCALESGETPVPAIAEYRLIFRQPDGDMRDVVRPLCYRCAKDKRAEFNELGARMSFIRHVNGTSILAP